MNVGIMFCSLHHTTPMDAYCVAPIFNYEHTKYGTFAFQFSILLDSVGTATQLVILPPHIP